MIETRRLKNVVVFIQTILSFVLSRKIVTTIAYCHFPWCSLHFWSTWFGTTSYFLSKQPKFKLSACCKFTSSWRFLFGLPCGDVAADSAEDSSSGVVLFSLSQNCLPPEYVTLVLGRNPWFLLFIFGLLYYCFSLYFWTLRAFWLTRFLNFFEGCTILFC